MLVLGFFSVVVFMKYSMLVVMPLLVLNFYNLFMNDEYNGVMSMDELKWMLLVLIVLLLLMIMYECGKMMLSVVFMVFALVLIVMVNSMFMFFVFYELLFILIMFSILVLGYSYERLMAGFMMMFYSFMFSSPTMVLLILMDNHMLYMESLNYSCILIYYILYSFVVKFPIFGFHYWLPVAHVEASTLGSIILAGVLLKMGGLGVWYVIKFMKFMMKFHWMMLGFLVMMMVILFSSDLKIMIAYSSVAHMSLMYYVMMLGYMVGLNGSVLMMFYHGVISSLMFWIVGVLSWIKTRSLMVTKLMSFSSCFLILVFVVLVMNMGFPPFMGFMSEVLMLKSLVNISWLIVFLGLIGVLFSCYYNVFIYSSLNGVHSEYLIVEMKVLSVFLMVLFVMMFINYY